MMGALERAIKALEPLEAAQARAVVESLARGDQAHAKMLREWGLDTGRKAGPALRKLATSTVKLRAALAGLAKGFPGLIPTASDPSLAALLDRLDSEAENVPRYKRGPSEDLSRRELLRQAFGALGELATAERVADLAMAARELATGVPPDGTQHWKRLADAVCADQRCTGRFLAFLAALERPGTFADLKAFTESEELR